MRSSTLAGTSVPPARTDDPPESTLRLRSQAKQSSEVGLRVGTLQFDRITGALTSKDRTATNDAMWRAVRALAMISVASCAASSDPPFCEPGLDCAAATADHCAAGREARLYGRSAFSGGTCVADDDDACAASMVTCRLWGQCHAPPEGHRPTGCAAEADRDFVASRDPRCAVGTCVAATDEGCQGARVCLVEGRCRAADGVCVADAERCRASELCESIGWCSLMGTRCGAASQDDCAQAEICRRYGKCHQSRGSCTACDRSAGCRDEGLCHQLNGRCAATIAAHCERSTACRRDGRCRLYHGACAP